MPKSKKKIWIIVGTITVVLCGSLLYLFSIALNIARDCQTFSCISSMYAFLVTENFDEKDLWYKTVSEEWQLLTDSEYKNLASKLSKAGIDCATNKPDKIMFDKWGRHIRIARRHRDMSNVEFIVWSLGHDGISGTKDDLVQPYDAVIPPALHKTGN